MPAQNAEEFLNTVIEKNKSYDDISITFDYTFKNVITGVKETTSGYGSMKGRSYFINVEGQEMISNGETLWTYLIDDEEVMISEVTDDNDSSPLAIIESFTENVNVSIAETNDRLTTIVITEKDGNTFEKVLIEVDTEMKIRKVHAFISDGNEFIYEIKDFKTNQNLPDSMFIFDEKIHPNVDVIDMR